jgi:hypothetical protein
MYIVDAHLKKHMGGNAKRLLDSCMLKQQKHK